MKTFDRIPTSCSIIEQEIQDRDYAIMELWHTLQGCINTNYDPVLEKYSDFVNKTKDIYGNYTYNRRIT